MMNKEPRDITIENSAFTLTLHWNPDVVLTQVCILAACVLCILLVPNSALKTLAIFGIVVDLISVFIGMFMKRDAPKENEKKKEKKSQSKPSNEKPATVEKEEKTEENHSSMSIESGNTVKNKLAIATPKKPSEQAKPVPATPPTTTAAEPDIEPDLPEIPQEIQAAFGDFFETGYDDDD